MPVARAAIREAISAEIARSGADLSEFLDDAETACSWARDPERDAEPTRTKAGDWDAADKGEGAGRDEGDGGVGEGTAAGAGWGEGVEPVWEEGGIAAWGATGTIGAIAPGCHPPGRLGRSPEGETGGKGETVADGCGADERWAARGERLRDG